MRVFNKKLNRVLAIMLASVMGATSLPATPVSADTPSSEYDISNDAASDDISDSKIPDEQDSDNNATEEKQPQQLTVEYTPADDIYVGNKVVPVVKSDRADAAVDNLKYTVVEGKNLIEKDTDFASNGIWTAKDTGTVRIKVTKAEDDKYKSAETEYTITIKEYDYSSMNNSLTGTMLQGTKFYVEAPTLSLASDNQAVYVVRKGDEWIEADKYQLMPQQGDNRQTLVIARKDKESGAITDIGSLQLDYKYDTQPPKITLNPKEDDKPAFTKDAVDYYGNVRKVDMNIHDVSLDDGSTQLWVKVDDREEFDVFDVDNAQKLIDAGIEYSDWIVTGADYSSCITFGTKADEEHKYQIIGMYAKDQAEHECNDTSSIEQPFYVDRKAPSGTIGYDADLIDEQNMVSQQASNVYGQLEDISGIKQAFYYVNKSDESGSILNDEQVKALDDSAWKPLELIEDTYDARYKYKINTSDLKDTSYNVYVKAQDNCNGETAFFSTLKLVVDTLPPELTVSQDTMTAADEKGWHKDDISYIVKADDSLSGIKSVEYTVFDGKRKIVSGQTIELDASGEGRITIPAAEQFNGTDLMLSVKATDYAGLKTEVKGDSFKFSMDSQSPDVSIEPEAGKNRKYFNDDVRIKTSVADSISGVVSAKYQIVTDDQSVSDDEGAWNELDESGIINVSAEAYLDKKVDVYVKAVDEAGNVTVADLTASGSQPFYIHKAAPVITVTYGTPEQPDPQCISSVKGTEYYRENRIATISVKENELFFDPDETKINVKVDGNEQTQSDAWSEKSYWVKTGEGAEAVYSKQLVFNAGHKYELSVSAKDLCGNSDNGFEIEGDKSAEFVIDVQSPTGNIRFDGLSTGMDTVWDLLLPKDKYEISRFAAKKVNIAGQLGDEHGGIKSAEYFVSAEDAIIDVDSIQEADWKTLDSLNEDGTFSEPIECENKNCVVYVRVTDLSGNVSYISTNGLVVDTCAPAISVITPETASGVYSADVPVSIEVSDENATGVASGIKSVNYTVTNMGQTTQDGTLYSYDKTAAGLKDLENHVTEQFDISAASNNSNEVRIDVTATDNAGTAYTVTKYIKIDTTAPTVQVSYDNNSADTSFGDTAYFKAPRTATVKVTERNFDASKVAAEIKAAAGKAPALSNWSTEGGSGNGDDTVHVATIYYGHDDDYTFGIGVKDIAGNAAAGVDYANSLAPTKFTIDTTAPVISVVYDNNSASNGNYYNNKRTATVTITEHNFDTSRIALSMTAQDAGKSVAAPAFGSWSDNGDIHTATLSFDADATYTWSLAYTDKAGNKAKDLANQEFCIDTTKPVVTINGVTPGSVNNNSGNMSFVIECTDTNLESFSPVLTVEVYENSRFVRKTITGNVISISNGQRVEFRNLNEDGVYSLTCHAQDKAGNSYETVNIIDAGGKQVTETAGQGEKLMDFSINKGGSIFSLDDNTMKLVKDYYVQKVYHDVVVREINPDEVTSCTVKVNGKALKQGTDFSVNNVSESDGWHKYEYVISNAVFEKEGQYNIVVETKDKADSVAYSDVKSVNIEFIVDKTAPTYTLTGVDKNNENYIGSKNAVLMPKDDGGKLGRVKITVVGKDDKEKKVIKEMSGDDMLDYLDKHDGKIEFEVPKEVLSAKDGDSRLMVECADCSVDEGGKTNEVKKIYGKDTEADTEIAEDDVPMESNSSDVKSVETNNDKAVYIIGAILLFVLIIAILIIVYYMRKKMKEKKDNDEQ